MSDRPQVDESEYMHILRRDESLTKIHVAANPCEEAPVRHRGPGTMFEPVYFGGFGFLGFTLLKF